MIDDKKKKCLGPWPGFLAIMFVCVVVASAIFFGFKGPRRRTNRLRGIPGKGTVRVNFGVPGADVYGYLDEKLAF